MVKLEVSNEELRTIRQAMHELNRMIPALESGDAEKFVLYGQGRGQRGKGGMRAVVISVETYIRLIERRDP